jgi:HK97 family phage portal protein
VSFLVARGSSGASGLIPSRVGWRGKASTRRGALGQSAMWASARLRADLISTLPVDVYRRVGRHQVEVPKPPVLVNPGGEHVDICEWLYSSQNDLDMVGNAFGVITEKDAAGKPARIDLVARQAVTVRSEKGVVTYWFDGKKQKDPSLVWHERQFTQSGQVLGLSPLAHAATTLQQHQAAQDFAAAWFGGGIVPSGHLKYGKSAVPTKQAESIKARFQLSIENGDPFVSGSDWEYKSTDVAQAQANFIEAMKFTDVEICRFMGVPGDLIDANETGASITYANITQRNLQFLVLNLGASIKRREKALSRMVADPRFVRLNSEALLRMDPETVSKMLGQQVKDRLRAPSEAREKLDLGPFTAEQLAEFKELFPAQYSKQVAERDLSSIGADA